MPVTHLQVGQLARRMRVVQADDIGFFTELTRERLVVLDSEALVWTEPL